MKKIKILPSILMLVACIAILGVGVFAVAPTQNTISGSITINSSNPEVEIMVYRVVKEGEGTKYEAISTSPYVARAGVDIALGNLEFNSQGANDIDEVEDIVIKFVVTNKSTERLGMYFATSPSVTQGTQTTDPVAYCDGAIKASFADYTELPASGNASITLTFSMEKFVDSSASLDLSTSNIFFNIETYSVTSISIDNEQYTYSNGKLALKAGADDGDHVFDSTAITAINNSLVANGVAKTDVKELDFGTSTFTTINGGLNNCDYDCVILADTVTTMYYIENAKIDKLWIPDTVKNWYGWDIDGYGVFKAFNYEEEVELDYGTGYIGITPSIIPYFDADLDDTASYED